MGSSTTTGKPKITYRVQHYPGRASIERLLPSLPSTVEVIEDEVSPWSGYRRCLADISSDYIVVLQDDAIVCRDFPLVCEKIAAARPESLVLLWTGGLRQRSQIEFLQALKEGKRFAPMYFRDIHFVVASLWPKAKAEHFLTWTETHKTPGRQPPKSDDASVGYWARNVHEQVLCSVPCIVEHPDDQPSTIGRWHKNGKDRGRVAIHFDPDACDLDWS